MTLASRQLRVFLCHSSGDKPAVRELYRKLAAEGWIDPWLDEEKLLPGQEWKDEIPKAVHAADVVVVCLSRSSITKEGYVQKEIRFTLDVAQEKPENVIFLIPACLDDCDVPERLRNWQWVDLYKEQGWERLLASLTLRADNLGIKTLFPKMETIKGQSVPPIPREWLPPNEAELSRQTWNGIEFVKIARGGFLYGDLNSEPRCAIDIPYDYWISRFPITNGQYEDFVIATGSSHPVQDWEKKMDYPVFDIGWKQSLSYCKWMNKKLKADSNLLASNIFSFLVPEFLSAVVSTKIPINSVLRLPTEAEWEIAARGRDARAWPWGNEFDKNQCNTLEGGKNGIVSVGQYSPSGDSPYGCADMAGNIWEWTYNVFDKANVKKAQRAPEARKLFVLRGGSFELTGYFATTYYRTTNYVEKYVGFRVVIAPPRLDHISVRAACPS